MNRLFLISLLSILISSCDSGDILERDVVVASSGKTVKLTAHLTGGNEWGTSYNIALAGFADQSDYAVVQRAIPPSTADDNDVELVLNNISSSVSTVEFCITDKLRKRIVSLISVNMDEYDEDGDTIRMNLGNMDVSTFGCIQTSILDKSCIQCHGGNGRYAGNLDLTAPNAKSNLVDVASQSSAASKGYTRVISGDPENSLLWQILNPGGENILHYNHTEVLSSQFKANLDDTKEFIYNWIKSLNSPPKPSQREGC